MVEMDVIETSSGLAETAPSKPVIPKWNSWQDSNLRPTGSKPVALFAELQEHKLVQPVGNDPTPSGLRVRRSAD